MSARTRTQRKARPTKRMAITDLSPKDTKGVKGGKARIDKASPVLRDLTPTKTSGGVSGSGLGKVQLQLEPLSDVLIKSAIAGSGGKA